MAWFRVPATSRKAAAKAAPTLAGTDSVARSIHVISVITRPPRMARANARPAGNRAYSVAMATAVGRSFGCPAMIRPVMTHPPTRFITAVPNHSRTSLAADARPAATAATGTRKFSVNSSLCASVRAMKPMPKASPASRTLPVSSFTSSRASTPTPTSRPPTAPVASRPGQLRVSRCSPSATVRSKVSVSSRPPPWASAVDFGGASVSGPACPLTFTLSPTAAMYPPPERPTPGPSA